MADILVADDDPGTLELMRVHLSCKGHAVAVAHDGGEAIAHALQRRFHLAFVDVQMPEADGFAVLREVVRRNVGTRVVLMTGYAEIKEAVRAIKCNATDYLAKPFHLDAIDAHVELVGDVRRGREAAADEAESALIGSSPAMVTLQRQIATITRTGGAVLITGESGVGKELVARAIHLGSARRGSAFVTVNCASFAEPLLEDELFGHVRGAFTGATQNRDGRFAAADSGVLFLDEIGEMTLPAQAKLLRVLEDGTFEPLGSNKQQRVDVRIVSATNRDLRQSVAEGRFRRDLFYRLNAFQICVPPLRQRLSDVPLLVAYFARRFSHDTPVTISPAAWALLKSYDFPGNVRELKHVVEHAVAFAGGAPIEEAHLPSELRRDDVVMEQPSLPCELAPLWVAMREFERDYLQQALRRAGGNKTRAAALLGIARKTLWQKMS
jgi:two-component system, NtrC family, response regulator AtoC